MRSRLNGAEIAMAIDVTLYQPGDEDIVLKLAKWFNEIHNAETPSPSSATASELLDESLKRKLHTLFYLPVKTLFADIIFGTSTDSVSVYAKHKIQNKIHKRFLRNHLLAAYNFGGSGVIGQRTIGQLATGQLAIGQRAIGQFGQLAYGQLVNSRLVNWKKFF